MFEKESCRCDLIFWLQNEKMSGAKKKNEIGNAAKSTMGDVEKGQENIENREKGELKRSPDQ